MKINNSNLGLNENKDIISTNKHTGKSSLNDFPLCNSEIFVYILISYFCMLFGTAFEDIHYNLSKVLFNINVNIK